MIAPYPDSLKSDATGHIELDPCLRLVVTLDADEAMDCRLWRRSAAERGPVATYHRTDAGWRLPIDRWRELRAVIDTLVHQWEAGR